MFINKNSIKLNNENIGGMLVEAKYGYNKLWSSDTGRNLAGKMTGTLIGIFPKITLQFRKLTKIEMENITPMLDAESQSLTYYDPTLHTTKTITTYASDYEITNKNIVNGTKKNEGFSVSLIAISRRS